MADSDGAVTSFEDQILQEREALRAQLHRQDANHRTQTDRLRTDFEKSLQDATSQIEDLRRQLATERSAGLELQRQHDIETRKAIEYKDALNSLEERNVRLASEKSNVVVLLESTRAELQTAREANSRHVHEKEAIAGELESLKLRLSSRESDLEFVKISERNLRSEKDRLRNEIARHHSLLIEKDTEITRVRSEGDRRVREESKKISSLDDELYMERRKVTALEESVRREKDALLELRAKYDEVERLRKRLEDEMTNQNSLHERSMDELKQLIEKYKQRITREDQEREVRDSERKDEDLSYHDGMKAVQEQLDQVVAELEERNEEVQRLTRELDSAGELVAYLKHDQSRTFPQELLHLVNDRAFSVTHLYHEYRMALDKLVEKERVLESQQDELDTLQLNRSSFVEDKARFEQMRGQVEAEISRMTASLEEAQSINTNLQQEKKTNLGKLRKFEKEIGMLTAKNASLEQKLAALLDHRSEAGANLDSSLRYQNTKELVAANLELQSKIGALEKQNEDVDEQIDLLTRERDAFRDSYNELKTFFQQKEQIEDKIRHISNEIQLYRMENSSPLLKDFFRTLSENEEQLTSLLALAQQEPALWSFIRANGGNEARDRFVKMEHELTSIKEERNSAVESVKKVRAEKETAVEKLQTDLRRVTEERDKARSEVEMERNGVELLKQESSHKTAEMGRQTHKINELWATLMDKEREISGVTKDLEQFKNSASQSASEAASLTMELSSARNECNVLREQQALLQRSVQEKSDLLQNIQQRNTQLSQDLQLAKDEATRTRRDVSSAEELENERKRHEATLKLLNDLKIQLNELRTSPRLSMDFAQPLPPASPSTSRGHVGSPDFAVSIIRQSSVQQEQLQHQITQLQHQLKTAQEEAAKKSAELEKWKAEASKRNQESSSMTSSMLSDMTRVKDERERLKENVRDIKSERDKLQGEVARLEAVERRLLGEVQDLNDRLGTEIKARQVILEGSVEVQKEIDQLKQTVALSRRHEQELTKSLEDLTKTSNQQEDHLKELISAMEQEREDSRSWKRSLYDRLRPSASAGVSDEVLDLTVLVDHQKKENDSLTKQLQLAKDEGFSSAAKLKAAQAMVVRLQEDLHATLQGREASGDSSSWRTSYMEQQAILTSTLEVNAKLRVDHSAALKELETLKRTVSATQEKLNPLELRVRELEQGNAQLQQESRTLKEQLERWNAQSGGSSTRETELVAKHRKAMSDQTERYNKSIKAQVAQKQEELKAKIGDNTALQAALEAKNQQLMDSTAQFEALQQQVQTMESSHSGHIAEMTIDLHHARDEIARLQEALRQKDEQLARLSEQIEAPQNEPENLSTAESHVAVQAETRPSSAGAGIPPRTTIHAQIGSPTHGSKSTAVVTPQAHAQPAGTSGTQVAGRSSGTIRTGNLPIVAVAPQAHEQPAPQTATVAPQPVASLSQQPLSTPPLHSDVMIVDPLDPSQPSTSHPAAPSPAFGLVQAVVQVPGFGGPSRRRPLDEESPSSGDPAAKRRNVGRAMTQRTHPTMRPPSPTSSDVTSSTTPQGVQGLVQQASVSEGVQPQPRLRSRSGGMAEGMSAAGPSSRVAPMDEDIVEIVEESVGTGEERGVDSSESVQAGGDASGEHVIDIEGEAAGTEEQIDEIEPDDGAEASESAMLSDYPVVIMISDEPSLSAQSSEAESYTEQPAQPSEVSIRGGGETGSDISSSEQQTRSLPDLTRDNALVVMRSVDVSGDRSTHGSRTQSDDDGEIVELGSNSQEGAVSVLEGRDHGLVMSMMGDQEERTEDDESIMQGLGETTASTSTGVSIGSQNSSATPILHQSGMTPTTSSTGVPRHARIQLRPLTSDVPQTRSLVSFVHPPAPGSPQRPSTRRPISPPRTQDDTSVPSGSGARPARPTGIYQPPRGRGGAGTGPPGVRRGVNRGGTRQPRPPFQ